LTHGVMKFFAEVSKVSVLRKASFLLLVTPAALLLPVVVRAGSAQDEATPPHAKTATTSSTAAKTTSKSATSKGTSSKKTSTTKTSSSAKKTSSAKSGAHAHTVSSKSTHKKHRHLSAHSKAQSVKLKRAFTASSQLRPMAQQLTQMRTPAAYSGITSWAHAHPGEGASAAYLAMGHAYLLDKRYPEAVSNLQSSKKQGESLADYADYLAAQAYLQANKLPEAEAVLNGFAVRYPDSIFVDSIPVLEANLFLQQGDPQAALHVLTAYAGKPIANHADFQFALAKASQMAGKTEEAAKIYRHIYLSYPLSGEAQQAKGQLATMGEMAPLTVAERRAHADALYAAGRWNDAAEDYRALAADAAADDALKNTLLVAAASCDWKLKRLSRETLDRIPDTNDETGARRMYLLMEMARSKDDSDTQRQIVDQMKVRFPQSPWFTEALYSSGNMYLLRKDYPRAIEYYGQVATLFPRSSYGPSSHWRAGWLNYRQGQYAEAARLFDEQIAVYAGGKEIPAALYWRGRIYEEQEHKPEVAAAYYKALSTTFLHYYYAQIARDRLAILRGVTPANLPLLASYKAAEIPSLSDDVPDDDPHMVKARLLANAGLNEYIPAEIQAADGSDGWSALAEAEIYSSYGENYRAMRVMKRAIPFYTSAPIESIPIAYWHILFPQPYWDHIKAEASKNALDPYMVASLIRQESEFNPGAISKANAYGLMQLLPSVGRQMAKAEGIHHFDASSLLDPLMNIRLGAHYLKQTLDKFGGQEALAFAAYNAGDERVTDWQAAGNYRSVEEFVESIPFTETREYVQALVRNERIYREIDRVKTASISTAQ
jgi:soluble lytic murein transglycosylase